MYRKINREEGEHARVDYSGLSRQNRGPLSVPGSNVGELYGNLGGSKPPRIYVPCHILRLYWPFDMTGGRGCRFLAHHPPSFGGMKILNVLTGRGGSEDVKPTDIRVRAAEGALEGYR